MGRGLLSSPPAPTPTALLADAVAAAAEARPPDFAALVLGSLAAWLLLLLLLLLLVVAYGSSQAGRAWAEPRGGGPRASEGSRGEVSGLRSLYGPCGWGWVRGVLESMAGLRARCLRVSLLGSVSRLQHAIWGTTQAMYTFPWPKAHVHSCRCMRGGPRHPVTQTQRTACFQREAQPARPPPAHLDALPGGAVAQEAVHVGPAAPRRRDTWRGVAGEGY